MIGNIIGRLWCIVMDALDRAGLHSTEAYVMAVVHCWFAGVNRVYTRRTLLDLLRLPILLAKRFTWG